MAKTYFLRWPANATDSFQWLLANGDTPGPVELGTLSVAAGHIGSNRCCVLLPADWVMSTRANVPVRGAQALRQAVPYALEDQFAIDVDRLQFAFGDRSAAGVAVQTVDKSLLTEVMDELQAAGIRPLRVVAEASLLPPDTVLVDGNRVVFNGEGQLGGTDIDMLPLLFSDGSWPSQLVITPSSQTAVARMKPGAEAMLVEESLPFLASQTAAAKAINLLQGEFAPEAELAKYVKRWRLPLAMAAAVAVALFVGKFIDLRDLRQQNDALYAEVKSVYESALPNARLTANPKPIIERALRGGGDAPLTGGVALELINAMGTALKGQKNTEITSMGYRSNGLDVRLQVPDLPALSPVEKALQAAGLETTIQSTSVRNDKTEVRMRVAAAGSEVAGR